MKRVLIKRYNNYIFSFSNVNIYTYYILICTKSMQHNDEQQRHLSIDFMHTNTHHSKYLY